MRSFRIQLLLIFLLFILISLITALYTANYYQKKQALIQLGTELDEAEILLLLSLKEQESFFNFETVNELFYENKKSSYLDRYHLNLSLLKKKIHQITANPFTDKDQKKRLSEIEKALSDYDISFQALVNTIHQRGFRNYGLIGRMREAAHQIEDEKLIPLKEILMLRRHEKDFIIRQNDLYLEKFKSQFKNSIQNLKHTTANHKEYLTSKRLLLEYDSLFNQMAELEKSIGLKTNLGLKSKLSESTAEITKQLELLKNSVHFSQERQIQQLNYSLLIFWLIYISLSIWLSYKIAKKFTHRITLLSRHINYFVNTNFTSRLDTEVKDSQDEIGILWENFRKMENEIIEYLELFKEKVEEKTLELSARNDQVQNQKMVLEKQKDELEQKHKDLMDGMKYGWRIQQALLPSKLRFSKQVEDGFILFKPKDIVSGDIYFAHKVNRKDGIENIFSVIDCTGHGVPGAFMSILAMNAINNAVIAIKHREPHYITQQANNFVYSSMKYYLNDFKKVNNKDGMDMLICKLKRQQLKLSYTGANRPLYLVRKVKGDQGIGLEDQEYSMIENGEHKLYEIYPDKKTVGTIRPEESSLFSVKEIRIQPSDMLFLSSDGYADQFGGPKNKKFMSKRLKLLLCSLYPLSTAEQKEKLKITFEDWKAEQDQIDDVCIMGVRV